MVFDLTLAMLARGQTVAQRELLVMAATCGLES